VVSLTRLDLGNASVKMKYPALKFADSLGPRLVGYIIKIRVGESQ